MKKLEAKTKEQQDYIAALVEEESCDGAVKVCEDGIDYTVDQCFGVGMSFDTMDEIVDYLRNEPVSEDLEKEIDLVEDKYHGFESLSRADVIDVAKHFFELGLKAQKGRRGMTDNELLNKALDFIVETQEQNDYICEQMVEEYVGNYCMNNCQNLNRQCVTMFLERIYKKEEA
mgnify:CR=1 FL=1